MCNEPEMRLVPVETKVKRHQDYTNAIYVHIGSKDMFTRSNEHIYGKALEELINPETERLAKKNTECRKMYTAYMQNAENGDARKAEYIGGKQPWKTQI